MKVVILGDLHFGSRNNNPNILNQQKRFFKDVFFPYLEKNDIKHVFQLGDVFDQRRNINVATMAEVNEFFVDPLASYNFYGLLGNHDIYYRNTNLVNTPEMLLPESFTSNMAVDDVLEVVLDDVKFALVPWLNSENSTKILDQLAKSDADVCLGHFEITGFEMTKGNLCSHGLDPNLFKSFKNLFSGHFHLRSKKSNIEFVGTPYWMDWNDWDTDKGFVVYDTETKTHEYVENPNPMFWKIPYTEGMDNIDGLSDCFIKLIVTGDVSKTGLDSFVKYINDQSPADLQIVSDKVEALSQDVDEEVVDIDTDEALSVIMDSVETNVDPMQLKTLIMKLYKEARSRL